MTTCTYVVPLRQIGMPVGDLADLVADVRRMRRAGCEVIVVDGSPPDDFARHAVALSSLCVHVPPDPRHQCLNGKVHGVRTGIALASHEDVVIADDDVVYTGADIERVRGLLAVYDLVVPQNRFHPLPWWAVVETGRTLLNRALRTAGDYPGTQAVRRSTFERIGAYDGDTLFENEEMRRHFVRQGARVAHARDLIVARRPPSLAKWREQRVRQAYEDLDMPLKTTVFAALLPIAVVLAFTGGLVWFVVAVAVVSMLLAAVGRRGAAARAAFLPRAVLLAPLWVVERSVSVYRALFARAVRGGCPYGGRVIARGLGVAGGR